MRPRVGAALLALLALLVTVGFHVWVVPQVLTEETGFEVGGVVQLVWWALAGLTLLLAVRAAVGLLPRRRA
jgi:hypothetical protein